MEPGPATTGEAAEEARQDQESRTESESDAPDYPSGSALPSRSKGPNPWNLVFKKFCSGKTDNAVNALIESTDTFLDAHAREHCVLGYPFGESSEKPQR